jgi:uncharacterized protein YabN with tetrapyrrole methylase and pyrophosphatase domain
MERAERLYYSVPDPVTELWLHKLNPAATSLNSLYGTHKDRRETYAEMTGTLVKAVREGLTVCGVFYGHPGVFVQPSHAAIRQLRKEGFSARMLPGVSTDGCLFADLGINPGDSGIQSFEATDFLLHRRRFDPTSGLILWQVGVLGEATLRLEHCRQPRVARLVSALLDHYPVTHRVALYLAPTFAGHLPDVTHLALDELQQVDVSPAATMYVPPLPEREPDPEIMNWYREA